MDGSRVIARWCLYESVRCLELWRCFMGDGNVRSAALSGIMICSHCAQFKTVLTLLLCILLQGLSNSQVLDFVQSGRVMDPPEKCPSILYELMTDCWKYDHRHRPTFFDILDRCFLYYPNVYVVILHIILLFVAG